MSAREAVLASWLAQLLGPFTFTHKLGRVVVETLFTLDPNSGLDRRPDVAFVSSERWPLRRPVPTTNAWEVVPNLAVEVVSKSNLAWELVAKIREYFTAGVQLVWVIYPTEGQVYIYESPTRIRVLQGSDELKAEPLVPGFRLPVSILFEEETAVE